MIPTTEQLTILLIGKRFRRRVPFAVAEGNDDPRLSMKAFNLPL
jgi:hypothetical protein